MKARVAVARRRVRQLAESACWIALLVPALLRSQTQVLIVSGLGGEPKYSQAFAQLSIRLADAVHTRFGVADSNIVWLGEDSAYNSPRFGGQSTKVNIERAITRMVTRARAGSQVAIVLIGHGSGDGAESRISVPGPDPTAADFALMLARFSAQRVAFLDFTSASGDMLPVLSAPNRVIVTATKSSFERNESHFGGFFVDALANDVADTDKDGRVSLLEAFRYAVAETKRLYDNDGRLQTEHAQLDDNGDGAGSDDPTGRTGEGVLARRFFLDAGPLALAGSNDPRIAALYGERFALEDQVEALKQQKATMAPDAYDAELERLLVALARKARDIRQMEGR